MAQQVRHVCTACARSVEAWDEGEPYVLRPDGTKRYVYHPNPEREWAVGVDTPYLCLTCATEFLADRSVGAHCPSCGGADTADTYALAGRPCPFCYAGTFGPAEPTGAIS